jgi:hypothetical protein
MGRNRWFCSGQFDTHYRSPDCNMAMTSVAADRMKRGMSPILDCSDTRKRAWHLARSCTSLG